MITGIFPAMTIKFRRKILNKIEDRYRVHHSRWSGKGGPFKREQVWMQEEKSGAWMGGKERERGGGRETERGRRDFYGEEHKYGVLFSGAPVGRLAGCPSDL